MYIVKKSKISYTSLLFPEAQIRVMESTCIVILSYLILSKSDQRNQNNSQKLFWTKSTTRILDHRAQSVEVFRS
jgi:hypothetical protein